MQANWWRRTKTIVIALNRLVEVTKGKNKNDIVDLAQQLKLQAKIEEEVTYPTALLFGEYL
ncbi:hypothetical protein ACSSV9_01310 [Melioribacter sp. OK-6-Me]|uniref:hypothetical protein n=1 Tax=unclassified Melioribacter TaxID=2627329 RepID=UPI003BBBD795